VNVPVVPDTAALKVPVVPDTAPLKVPVVPETAALKVPVVPETAPLNVPVVPETAPREVSDPEVKLVTIPVVALNVAAVVIPAMSTPVGDNVTVPTPDRLLILSTLISDAIWVHFPPLVLVIYGNEWSKQCDKLLYP
jgi:hypothetical protein